MPRVDIPASVDGSQLYGVNISLPGMVYAAIAQCPVFGGKVESFDATEVHNRRGILVVFAIYYGTALDSETGTLRAGELRKSQFFGGGAAGH